MIAARPFSLLLISRRLTTKLEEKLRQQLLVIRKGLNKERQLTQAMLLTYYEYSTGEISVEDLRRANRQFRSFMKTLGMGALVILPFAPLTLPAIIMLGKRVGVDVIPDSFKEDFPEVDQHLQQKLK